MSRGCTLIGCRTAGIVIVAAAVGAAGCGRTTPLVPVTGRVMFADEQPVAAGTIEFQPHGEGPSARAGIAADGRFVLRTAGRPGAVAGEHDVLVVQISVVEGVEHHVHRGSAAAPSHRRVHERHAQTGRSGLTVTVKPNEPNDVVIVVDQQPKSR
jgi:hypothetical protein